jgi:hypothetical protein
MQYVLAMRRLDSPGQMNDRIGATKSPDEVVARNVGLDPARLRHAPARPAPGDAEDGRDARIGCERSDDARADVSGRSCDDDVHGSHDRPTAFVVK